MKSDHEQKIVGLIMTGGKNSRMGGNIKLFLKVGEKTFFQRIMEAMDGIEEVYLSVNIPEPYEELGLPMVIDEIAGIGPIGGLMSAMHEVEADAFIVVASDMPFVSSDIIKRIKNAWEADPNCYVVRTLPDRREHPLLAIYPKSMLPIIEKNVSEGNYRMMAPLREAGLRYIDIDTDDPSVRNVNSIEDYQNITK